MWKTFFKIFSGKAWFAMMGHEWLTMNWSIEYDKDCGKGEYLKIGTYMKSLKINRDWYKRLLEKVKNVKNREYKKIGTEI